MKGQFQTSFQNTEVISCVRLHSHDCILYFNDEGMLSRNNILLKGNFNKTKLY